MNHVSGFGIGIRQDLEGDRRWVPWSNAPPDTNQELGIFWLPSLARGEKLFDRVVPDLILEGLKEIVRLNR